MSQDKVICPYCGKEAEWVENKEVYGKNLGKSFMMYLCRVCDARVGCHNNTRSSLGTMANKELRDKRMEVHALIDPLWKKDDSTLYRKQKSRKIVYKRLKEAFGFEVHIGHSNLEMCNEIIKTAKLVFNIK